MFGSSRTDKWNQFCLGKLMSMWSLTMSCLFFLAFHLEHRACLVPCWLWLHWQLRRRGLEPELHQTARRGETLLHLWKRNWGCFTCMDAKLVSGAPAPATECLRRNRTKCALSLVYGLHYQLLGSDKK